MSTSEMAVLFADVSGSAALLEKLGEAETARAVERCLTRVERAIDGFGGEALKKAGDELMVVFNNAEDAFHSAVEMQQRVASLPPVSGVKLSLRIGFEYGGVQRNGDALTGDTVRQAARLAGLARSGHILTSTTATSLLSPSLQAHTKENKDAKALEVTWQGLTDLPKSSTAVPRVSSDKIAPATQQRLCVRYREHVLTISSRKPSLSMGRDNACDLVIQDRRASRLHATIQLCDGAFVLSDRSTNGTYVSIEDHLEQLVKKSDLVLSGRSGVICFATSAASEGSDTVRFEVL